MPKLSRLIDIKLPETTGPFSDVDAIFIRQDLRTLEFHWIFVQCTEDGGYLQVGDAPKSAFIENRPDVYLWLPLLIGDVKRTE